MFKIKKGFYRHFKGHVYYVLGVGCLKHEENRRIVAYTSVKTEEQDDFDFLLRDEEDFMKWIKGEEGARVEISPPILHEEFLLLEKSNFEPRFGRVTDPEKSKLP